MLNTLHAFSHLILNKTEAGTIISFILEVMWCMEEKCLAKVTMVD